MGEDTDIGVMDMDINEGSIKWFNSSKGFGFIEQEGSPDIFIHISKCMGFKPKEGDLVVFDLETGRKGLVAINVGLNLIDN